MEKISKTFGSQISSLSEKHLKVSKRKENFYESPIVANLDDENDGKDYAVEVVDTFYVGKTRVSLIHFVASW